MIDEKVQESVYSDVEEQEDETILNYLETEENEDVVKQLLLEMLEVYKEYLVKQANIEKID